MEKTIVSTKSLIDFDISSESESKAIGISSSKEKRPEQRDCCHQEEDEDVGGLSYQDREEDVSIPSLVDASDFDEENQSQTSVTSSLQSIKEGTTIGAQDTPLNSQSTSSSIRVKNGDPSTLVANEIQQWDDGEDRYPNRSYERGGGIKDPDSPIVRKGVSDETVNTSNIIDVSSRELFLGADGNLHDTGATPTEDQQRHQLENKLNSPSKDNQQHIDNAPISANGTIDGSCRSVFEKSIDYVTEFFSCSTPNIAVSENTNSTDAGSGSQGNTARGEVGSELEFQIQKLQTCIEIDILNIMGCSAEGAQQLIDSLGQSICCQQCQCSTMGSNAKLCQRCSPTNTDSTLNRPKIRNRNVYVRSKATRRIQRLREGGLSRHFSLSPVYTFLAEEIDVVHEESAPRKATSEESETGKKPDSGKRLIPLSKRPKSLSGDKRQTSLGGCSTSSQYEPTILATRSYDFSINNEFDEEDEINTYKREVQSDTCARIGSVVGERLLSRIFQTSRDQRNSVASEDEQIPDDLYYDSDPGTHVGSVIGDKSELRKVVAKGSHGRSKSVGIVDGITADLRLFETNLFATKKSFLETLDIYTFDINDSAAISLLIKELIASNFALIWHPNKDAKSWSDSSTAPPHRVKAWFEMGSCLKKALLQPKFVWRSNDNLKYSSRQMKVKSIHMPESIELLNIVRIVVPKEIDRQLHPFVKKESAFTIVTNAEEEYLFEAATQDERDKFVFAFKVMVARLASKIIVGDKDVFDEFFTPLGVVRKKKKKRRRKRDRKRGTMNSGVIFMDEVGDVGSDSFSVSSEASSTSNFCTVIVGSVEEESHRKDELWGT